MSYLDELIEELCLEGVVNYSLADVLRIRNGKDYKTFGAGDYPVYGSGGIMTYIDQFAYDKPSVLIPRKGSIDKLYYIDSPFWTVDTIFYTEIDEEVVIPKYVYYWLEKEHLEDLNTAGGVPSLTQAVLNNVKIQVPPLPIQREIVRILDNFTELTAELTARKTQFNFYRSELLSVERLKKMSGFSFKKLHNVSDNKNTQRKPVKQSFRIAGKYPYYGASGIVDYVDSYIFDGEYLLISEDGANLVARNTPIAFSIRGKTWVNNHAHVLEFKHKTTQRYVEFYLNSIDLSKYLSTAAQPKLTKENLYKIPIPFPSMEEQERIVEILTKLDTLCNDLTSGIPAEIEARKKQYEYYRDKLLTFKEKTA